MKRVISVFAVAFLFTSLMSAIPIVHADITMTPEFENPVENWSFEERDMSFPGMGVFKSPHWETSNNGGWRELPGDINGDGIVNEIDQDILTAAFWSEPGDPNWNPLADLDGDQFVDISDMSLVSYYFGQEANRIHGSYSWYTGGGEYLMWQELDNSVIPAIAGKTVMFGFWFLPHVVSGDGSENNARAEIYYEYTTPPPPPPPPSNGGGCPFVSTWNGADYVLDNNLLLASEASGGTDVVDYYSLQQLLVPDDDGMYRLVLSEFENEHGFFDQVQLVAVDHSSDVNVAVSPYGEILTYTEPSPPVSAINNNHRNLKHILSAIDGDYYEGHKGSYVDLNFGSELDVSEGAKLVIRADPPLKEAWSIHVQIQDENRNWNTVAALLTREYWATEIVDLSEYLPDAMGNLKVRLYFTADHKIDFVGLDTSPQAEIRTQQGELVSATHSKEGDPTVNEAPEGIEAGSRLLYDDDVYAEVLPYEQIELAFAIPEVSISLTRDFVLVSKGHYSTLPEGTLVDPVVYGVWIAPTEQKWYNAYVTVYLPSTTTLVKVILHGKPDFRAWIDSASLHIIDTTNQEGEYGSLNLGVNFISYRQDPGMDLEGIVRLVPCVYAEAYNEYKIHWIELKVTVVEGGALDNLYIDHAGQENNEGVVIDPAAEEARQEQAIQVVSLLAGYTASIALSYGVGVVLGAVEVESLLVGIYTRATASTIAAAVIRHVLRYYASDPSEESGTCVWEHWGYPFVSMPSEDGFVEAAGTHFDLNWFFDPESGTDFEIHVESTICWAVKVPHYEGPVLAYYELIDLATWTKELVVHIVA